jgi:hypothetical protein
MDSMKKTLSQILCLSLSFQIAFGTFALQQAVAQARVYPNEKTSPAEFYKAVQDEGEALFGQGGPAYVDEKTGKIYIKNNSTTSSALHDDENKANSLNTLERIKAYLPRAKAAQESYAKLKDDKKDELNKSCPTCGNSNYVNTLAKEDAQIPPDGLCSKNDKKAIASKIASDPKNCGWGAEYNKATSKPGNAVRCLADAIDSFFASLGTMAKSVWNLGMGMGKTSAKSKLFESYKPVEKAASGTGLMLSGMSQKDRDLARKNVDAANSSFKQKILDGLSWFGQWIVNLDVPMYKEIMQCAKCGERGAAICKLMGVIGKDIVQNLIIMYIGGKVVQGIAKYGAKVVESAGAKAFASAASKTLVGRVAVSWGSKAASLSVKAATAYTRWAENTYAGKAVAALVKGGMKIVTIGDDIMMGMANKAKALPRVIGIRTGKKTATEIAEQTARSVKFANTPVLDEAKNIAKAETPGLSTLNDVATTSKTLNIEVPRPVTPNMQKAKNTIARMEKAGAKRSGKAVSSEVKLADDIENVTKTEVQVVNDKSIKVNTPDGEKYVNVKETNVNLQALKKEDVSFMHYGTNSEKGILRVKDKVYFTHEGQIVKPASKAEKDAIETIVKEEGAAGSKAVKDAEENVIASGGKVEEPNASFKDKEGFQTKPTGEGCGDNPINITKAL